MTYLVFRRVRPDAESGQPSRRCHALLKSTFLVLGQALNAELLQKLIKHHAMKVVDPGPRELAGTHEVHRGAVSASPCVRELFPVDVRDSLVLGQLLALTGDAGAPVDNGAKDVEHQRL